MARSTIITALWLSLALFLGLPLLSESYKYHLGRPSAMVHSSSSCSTSSSRHLPRRLPHFAEPGKDNFNPNERRMITRENEGEFFESDVSLLLLLLLLLPLSL
eukprot:scaffold7806_cov250-Ochromonas_danica.AAC.11